MPFWKDEEFSPALLTDLYQVTMACAYWKSGTWRKEAVFHLNYRKNPFAGGFAVACGLENVVRLIEQFRVSKSDVRYLGGITGADGKEMFPGQFLEFLSDLKLIAMWTRFRRGSLCFQISHCSGLQGRSSSVNYWKRHSLILLTLKHWWRQRRRDFVLQPEVNR